ncbi:hypothetical protein M758_UG170200 [Ceratodon purpureus]|nr:hypothetical protein M758_UG170200 [Ceratodon purpureus]
MGVTEYPCACRRCRGARIRSAVTVTRHHKPYGKDHYLPHPILSVDGRRLRGPGRETDDDDDSETDSTSDHSGDSEEPKPSPVRVRRMAFDAYARADDLYRSAVEGLNEGESGVNEADFEDIEDMDFKNTM